METHHTVVKLCRFTPTHPTCYSDIREGKDFYGSLQHRTRPSVDKCSFCAHLVMKGQKPACVETCVGSARLFGDLNDPKDEVTKLVKTGLAKPLMAHLGTRPNVYYISDIERTG